MALKRTKTGAASSRQAAAMAAADTDVASLKMVAGRVVPPRTHKRSPGRPTTRQSNKLREAILHAALQAFMSKGFDAASIESIARAAKTAKITIYRQFSSKENLFYEVTHHAQAEVRQNLQSFIDVNKPPSEALKQLIDGLHVGMTHPNYLAILRLVISESERFPSVAAAMLQDTDFFLEPVINYLQDLKTKGVIDVESARDAAIQLSCLAGGGARYLMIKPSNLPSARTHWSDSLFKLFSAAWKLKDPSTKKTSGKKTVPTGGA